MTDFGDRIVICEMEGHRVGVRNCGTRRARMKIGTENLDRGKAFVTRNRD